MTKRRSINEMSTSRGCAVEENIVSILCPSSKECNADPKMSVAKNDNGRELSVEDTTATDGLATNSTVGGSLAPSAIDSSQLEPKVGMVFYSEDEAYNFYNLYAKKKGFSVRKDHLSRRRDGSISIRHYLCSNEGTRQKHHMHITRRPRPILRTNCLARIEFKVSHDNVWVVSKFVDEHNHPLASPNNSHMLRSHRTKLPVQRAIHMKSDDYFGLKAAQLHDFPGEGIHCTDDDGLLLKNKSNILNTRRMRDLDKGDTQFLLDFLKAKQSEDPSFFYAVQLDAKERVTNFFWADARSVIDYAYFGDAVSFDTTYQMNGCDIPFAPFIGINHHKQIVIFGAALLLDETVESFIWLFKTFMVAMSDKQPKTIFTGQCAALSEALSVSLPETCHRLCLWQILQNAPKYLPTVCNCEPDFLSEFENCIYEGGLEDDFHRGWDNLISKYGLSGNSWLKDLFADREKWALVYCSRPFSAIMTTKQWAESMGNLFKIHFNRKLPLTKFMIQYLKALVHIHEKELLEDYESRQTKPVLFVDIPMLNQAAGSYTRMIYADFEHEYKSQLSCLCEPVCMDGTVCTFRVFVPQKQCDGIVEFDPSNATVRCSCKKYESMGILCMHALKVLNNNNILDLPSQYILKRWTKYAKDGAVSAGHQLLVDFNGLVPLTLQYSHVCHKAVAVAVKSAVSKDTLDILERGLDRFIAEMEAVSHNSFSNSRTDDASVIDGSQQNTVEAGNICFDGLDLGAS